MLTFCKNSTCDQNSYPFNDVGFRKTGKTYWSQLQFLLISQLSTTQTMKCPRVRTKAAAAKAALLAGIAGAVLFAALLAAAALFAVELFPESRPPLAGSFLADGEGGWTPPEAECCWPEEEEPAGLFPPGGPPGLCGWWAGEPPAAVY